MKPRVTGKMLRAMQGIGVGDGDGDTLDVGTWVDENTGIELEEKS